MRETSARMWVNEDSKPMLRAHSSRRASLHRLWDLEIKRVITARGAIFEQLTNDDMRQLCRRHYE